MPYNVFMSLTDKQINRYSRQIILSGVGGAGQEKLLSSKVLVVGAGGLGSCLLLNLASSGIGTIGIVDYDKVEISNLHRQIIHSEEDVGKLKVDSAFEKIKKTNSDIKVITYAEKISTDNIEKIFNEYEIIVDGLDNFKDKFLLNDYAVKMKKILIHAGVVGYEGQIMSIIPGNSANLRSIFPDGINDNLNQSCKDVGVLSTCVSVISSIQANEVLKIVLKVGKPLADRVLKFNALESKFYEMELVF